MEESQAGSLDDVGGAGGGVAITCLAVLVVGGIEIVAAKQIGVAEAFHSSIKRAFDADGEFVAEKLRISPRHDVALRVALVVEVCADIDRASKAGQEA